jgi:polysaccharide chain length determinant protein (PEP-CTERM system associated)
MLDDAPLPEREAPTRELRDYMEIPLRYPRAFWIPYLAVLVLTAAAIFLLPEKFRSSTLILVENTNLPEHFVTPVSSENITQQLHTIRQVMLSRTNLEAVIQKLDPYPEAAGIPTHVVVERMRAAVEIRVQENDSFVVEYVNRDPYKAMTVTNMLADRFIEDADRIRDTLTKRAYAFIESNLDDARQKLESREGALRQHKQRYWGALPEQLASNLAMLQQSQLEQQTLGENLRTLEERRAGLERSMLDGRRAAGGGALAELAAEKAELQKLRNRYTEQHPEVQALQLRIKRLEDRLAAGDPATAATPDPELASLFRSLKLVESEIEAVKTRRNQLDEKIALYQSRVELTPKAEQELTTLTRDYQQLSENYTQMLRKEMDAEMARKLEQYWRGGHFRILDSAHLPRRPIRPYAGLLLLGGLGLAFFLGLASTLAADFLDRSLKTEQDVEAYLPYPVLVTLPRFAASGRTSGS